MSWLREGRRAAVTAGVLVVLTSGVVSAIGFEGRPSSSVTAAGRVASAGLIPAGELDRVGTPLAPTIVSVAPASSEETTTTVPRSPMTASPSTSTTGPTGSGNAASTTTVPTMPPGNIPAGSSWQYVGDGVEARMRIEPATPEPGQPVRFFLEFSGVDACCYLFLHFGDDERFALNNDWMCVGETPLRPGAHSAAVTHTYARPGAYGVHLQVLDGDLCTLPPVHPEGEPLPLHNGDVHGCIAIGTKAAVEGCSPPPKLWPMPPS